MDFLLGFAGYGDILIGERLTFVTHLITNITEVSSQNPVASSRR